MSQSNVQEYEWLIRKLRDGSQSPAPDKTYELVIKRAIEQMTVLKENTVPALDAYLLEDNLFILKVEIDTLEMERKIALCEDFTNHPRLVGIENSLRSLCAEYEDEANKRGLASVVSEVDSKVKEKNKIDDIYKFSRNVVHQGVSTEKKTSSDDSDFPVLDEKYGYVIENATEVLKKIKEGSTKSPYTLEHHMAWLESEMECLEDERDFYGDFVNHAKIDSFEKSLRSLYGQYLEESKKRNLSNNLSELKLNPNEAGNI